MKAIHALIPATLLAGTVFSGPVEANGTANAWSAISRPDYYIVMNAKRHDKVIKVGSLNAHKKAPAAGKATKKVVKTLAVKPRKKPAKIAVTDKKPKTASVVPSKPEESEPRKFVRLEPAPMSKVLRSGPREVKNLVAGEVVQVSEAGEVEIARLEPAPMSKVMRSGPREVKKIGSGGAPHVSEDSEVEIARLEPAPMSKVLRSGPREVETIMSGALRVSGASEVEIVCLEPAPMSKVLRSGPREVKNIKLGEALQDAGAGGVEIARLEPAPRIKVLRSAPRELKNVELGETLQVSGVSEAEIEPLEAARLSKVLRSGPREVKNVVSDEALQVGEDSDEEIAAIIREMAPYYGVPTWFALRIADVESDYDPYARGRAGEIGVYQLKCQTARVMGFEGDCTDLIDARTNVRWGLKHLARAIALSGGNLRLAASKHNAGLSRKSLVQGYIAKVF